MSIWSIGKSLEVDYGLIRYYKGSRLYNDEKLRGFNKGKIKADELLTVDSALADLYEITKEQVGQALKESEQVVAIIIRPEIEKNYILDGNPLFEFCGYDLIDTQTGVSAINNCGADFDDAIDYDALNGYGLISEYRQTVLTQLDLSDAYPEEPHAYCEIVEIWRALPGDLK